MTKKTAGNAATLEVQAPTFAVAEMHLGIRGTAPLLMNRCDMEASKKLAKNKNAQPEDWLALYTHVDPDGHVIFPAVAFQRAIKDAARCFNKSKPGTKIAANIWVAGPSVRIDFKRRRRFTVWVNRPPGARGTPQQCHRPMFENWRTSLTVRHNAAVFSVDDVLEIFQAAGAAIGIGAGRPGSPSGGIGMGTFEVDLPR